jgi:hypothetical protein
MRDSRKMRMETRIAIAHITTKVFGVIEVFGAFSETERSGIDINRAIELAVGATA